MKRVVRVQGPTLSSFVQQAINPQVVCVNFIITRSRIAVQASESVYCYMLLFLFTLGCLWIRRHETWLTAAGVLLLCAAGCSYRPRTGGVRHILSHTSLESISRTLNLIQRTNHNKRSSHSDTLHIVILELNTPTKPHCKS